MKKERTASQRGRHAHRKGGKGEREVIALLAPLGFDSRRRPQYRGGVKDGPDVKCVRGELNLGVESKLQQKISVHAVIKQAVEAVEPGQHPIGYMRRDREKAIIVMPAETFVDLLTYLLPPKQKVGWKKRPKSRKDQALRKARYHVLRQKEHGSHEQDRADAVAWIEKFGDLCQT